MNPAIDNESSIQAPVGYPGVDSALWVYFERFEAEAEARDLRIDLRAERVTGVIEELDGERVAGQCSFTRFRPNQVTVDEQFWELSNDRFREFIVFHELGHCVLLRAHREAADRRNVCQSIMRSGNDGCQDNYNAFTRTRYLDELFDPQFEGDILQ